MTNQNKYLASVFPRPPITAFRRQTNLRNLLIRAKVAQPPKFHEERHIKGMVKCGKGWTAHPYVKQCKSIKKDKNQTWKMQKKLSCTNYNMVYMIIWNKSNCKENKYIRETGRILKYRLAHHRGYVNNKVTSQATGQHFNLPHHDTGTNETSTQPLCRLTARWPVPFR